MSVTVSVTLDADDADALVRAAEASCALLAVCPGRLTVWHGATEAFSAVVRADGTGAAAFAGAASRRRRRLLARLGRATLLAPVSRASADGQRAAYALKRLSPSLALALLRRRLALRRA